MVTPDVSLLVAASREDHPQHVAAHAWLGDALATRRGERPFSVLPMVAAGFVRVVAQARVFPDPTSPAQATACIDVLLARRGVGMTQLGGEWPILARLCEELHASGNQVPDAWIAAAVPHHREHLVTFDRGFRRLLPARHVTVLHS